VTPQRARAYIVLSVILFGALAANLFLLQPPGGSRGAPERSRGAHHGAGEGAATSLGAVTDEETTRAVQRELHRRGYYPGPLDGALSIMTAAAAMGFEYDSGLPLTGAPTEPLLKALLFADRSQRGPRAEARLVTGTAAEEVVAHVQRSLARLGYGVGSTDGRLSSETVRAIREFEMDQGLQPTGRISGPLIEKLSRPRQARNTGIRQ